MRNILRVKPFFVFIAAGALIQLWLSYYASGGVDVNRYWNRLQSISFSELYYLKEIVSWSLLYISSIHDNSVLFLFGLSITILFISIILIGSINGIILYSSFLSPFGVLLEFNVLRQYIGTAFLAMAFLSLSDRAKRGFFILSVLAILSHNGLVAVFIPVLFVVLASKIRLYDRCVFAVIFLLIVAALETADIFDEIVELRYEALSVDVGDGIENQIYIIIAFAYSFILYMIVRDRRHIAMGFMLSILVSWVICYYFSFNSWVYGRIAISIIVLSTFLLFENHVGSAVRDSRRAAICYGVFIINCSLLFAHPGALSMLG